MQTVRCFRIAVWKYEVLLKTVKKQFKSRIGNFLCDDSQSTDMTTDHYRSNKPKSMAALWFAIGLVYYSVL